ncbi:MAG: hypothetical protein KDA37_18185 [Planctomycetales bacterium]|nr:hypothetical protein [Planctomycetales bacterium]
MRSDLVTREGAAVDPVDWRSLSAHRSGEERSLRNWAKLEAKSASTEEDLRAEYTRMPGRDRLSAAASVALELAGWLVSSLAGYLKS